MTGQQSSIAPASPVAVRVDIDDNERRILPALQGDHVPLRKEFLDPREFHSIAVTMLDSSSTIQLRGIWLSHDSTIFGSAEIWRPDQIGRPKKTETVSDSRRGNKVGRRIVEIIDDSSRSSLRFLTNAGQNPDIAAASSATWHHNIGDVLGTGTLSFLPRQETKDWMGKNATNNNIDASQSYFRR